MAKETIKVKIGKGFGPWEPKELLLSLNVFAKDPPIKDIREDGKELSIILNECSGAANAVTRFISKTGGLSAVI